MTYSLFQPNAGNLYTAGWTELNWTGLERVFIHSGDRLFFNCFYNVCVYSTILWLVVIGHWSLGWADHAVQIWPASLVHMTEINRKGWWAFCLELDFHLISFGFEAWWGFELVLNNLFTITYRTLEVYAIKSTERTIVLLVKLYTANF